MYVDLFIIKQRGECLNAQLLTRSTFIASLFDESEEFKKTISEIKDLIEQ